MYQFNQIHSSVGSNSSSSGSHHNSPAYSSPYGSLSDPMVDEFLRDAGHMIPHNTQYDNMDIDPSRLQSAASPTATGPRQPSMRQEHLDAFIDFDAERSGRTFEPQQMAPIKGEHFDTGDWSWFDNMVTAPSSYSHHQYHYHHHPGAFSTDNHHNELSHDSPGALDSGTSSYSR